MLGAAYGANQDLLTAGALLHDIGKLEELDYDRSTSYSREGNLVGPRHARHDDGARGDGGHSGLP